MPIMRLQGEDNVIIRVTTMISYLVWINILTIICCLPIVTAGAALTAMHDELQLISRKEEGYITRRFFTTFRSNLKQATLLWIPFMLIFAGCVADVVIIMVSPGFIPNYIMIPAGAAGLIAWFVFQWVFPLQARFEGGFGVVMRMAFLLSAAQFPRTFFMAAAGILTVLAAGSLLTLPFVVLFGFSVPAMISVKLYKSVFEDLEKDEE